MNFLKVVYRPLTTYQEVEEGSLIYFKQPLQHNAFLKAINIDPMEIYEKTFKPKVQVIADQKLSMGAFLQDTGEMICALIAVDATTEFQFEIENKILRANEAFFNEGKARIFSELSSKPKFGECIESMVSGVKSEYMKLSVGKATEFMMVKHHVGRGYKYQYGECVVPGIQYLWDILDVPYLSMRIFYKDFEYEGETVFEKLDYGNEYKYGKPCALFFIITYENLLESGMRMINKKLKQASPKL